ncbi:MAG: arginase [Pseudonocardiales bacterium]|nr:MAG: arginase [Pseudonocardiales bacterium]
MIVAVPYHLDDRLPGLDLGMLADHEVIVDLRTGTAWQRMAVLYEQVARVVAGATSPPLIVSGDCTTSLGVLAGLQRAGRDVGIVWFDAHADFHTEATTTSGYLGGMPLALAAGVGVLTLPDALGLRAVAQSRIVLIDARDTDPGEQVLLEGSAVVRRSVQDLTEADLPSGELYLHVDVDVCDPEAIPDLLYPAPGGPPLDNVLAAVHRVAATGRVAAVGIAATWRQNGPGAAAHRKFTRQLRQALDGSTC